ncbi:TPA: hypothetical protein TUL06_000466 [Streptococcus equi subsp. zooepidemicus]|uniref:DUF304 domain-containing protein n=1 Tax=Streptococcus equi subsp. zooepidemicus Sz4is TaxID=1381082 RepID=A0AAW3GNI6_STRSZ|nr:hypothetical protein AT55_02005 [Streptococcus equi subsp. zooepidemicus Sz4is]HEL0009218.1 hypothetical protein [Streptococcus equi subsp. zooepidemicus]HEL0011291.1 hypothetical protein [Streptococcus equi subsp. zooepidemicus]HEL0013361.1 hypothetical protein [Streptococcus equi subsp. zooepidemicus]HEL0017469.1 hypothetical protein [Streptococcus equi subsp. zooepidemicus]
MFSDGLFNLPYIFWMVILVIFIPILIIGGISIATLIRLGIKERTIGAFHIENGILFIHGIIPKKLIITQIETIEINSHLLTKNGRKCFVNIIMKDNRTAGFLITHNIEDELKRFKQELLNNGYFGLF